MKSVSTKIAYMVIGSILTIIGYHFGNIDNNTAEAQRDDPIDDEIRCRRLVLVGDDDTPRIILETSPGDDGRIRIGNQNRKLRVVLGVAVIDGIETGEIHVIDTEDKVAGSIASDMHGGYMAVYSRDGATRRPLAQISTTEKGNGVVSVRDKDGLLLPGLGKDGDPFRDQVSSPNEDLLDLGGPKSATFVPGPVLIVSEILQKGDKLQRFNFSNDVKDQESVTYVVAKNSRSLNKSYDGPFIWFTKKNAWIELTNGTRYTCKTENCIIDMETYTISTGEISVSYRNTK